MAGAVAQQAPSGIWTGRNGQRFAAELLAADGLRATFGPAEKPKFVLPLKDLSAEDAETIRMWRLRNYFAPLVDPACLAAWPAQAVTERAEVRFAGEDAGTFTYESAHFRMMSDVKLPDAAVRDIATVFEATRAALMAMPLGLHAGGEYDKYPVLLISTLESYTANGGPAGSGGHYEGHTRRMLVLLPNLGIEQKAGTVRLNYGDKFFVLKHEVTHQLLARWHARLPMWLSEGIAEFIASLPYHQGTYTLKNPAAGMREYVLKWRKARDDRSVRLIPATELMAMNAQDWRRPVEQQSAYDLYNSAALLMLYFIQQENGAPVAAYFEALRRGRPDAEAELLRGRTRDQVAAAVAALAKKLGLEVK
jgi:hypothetical protein